MKDKRQCQQGDYKQSFQVRRRVDLLVSATRGAVEKMIWCEYGYVRYKERVFFVRVFADRGCVEMNAGARHRCRARLRGDREESRFG